MSNSYFGRILELLRDVISKLPVYIFVPRFNHGSRCVRIVCVQNGHDNLAPIDNYWPSHEKCDCLLFSGLSICLHLLGRIFVKCHIRNIY